MRINRNIIKALGAAVVAAPLAFTATPAKAVAVGLELSLLIDVSGSVDATEYDLQKTGYVQAFQSAAVQNAILASQLGSIAVNFIQWSDGGQQAQSVSWTLINSAASANAFATAVNGITRAFNGNTAPGSAIAFATPLFTNGFEGNRQVIDVSGDGSENAGINTAAARDAALADGVDAINGLAILGSEAGLDVWYDTNIKGGVGSFVIVANSFDDFAAAIEDKLIKEITGQVPEPATLALLGAALFGLGAIRRRKV